MVRESTEKVLSPATGGQQLASFHEAPIASTEVSLYALIIVVTTRSTRAPQDLSLVHCPRYIQRFLSGDMSKEELRRIGFPWSTATVARTLSSVGGTVAATHAVLSPGGPPIAGHLAGGTHHAFRDRGEGYCIFSDIAVAASVALRDHYSAVQRILILDLDVHQGNGNAHIFRHRPDVFTASLHCRQNIFSETQQSDLDINLEAGDGDARYMEMLGSCLHPLLDGQWEGQIGPPDLVFFQAGVDPSQHDRLGRLKLSPQGLRDRNWAVYRAALDRGIPLVVTMGGGYPKDLEPDSEAFQQIVEQHRDVYVDAAHALRAHHYGEPAS